MTKRRLLEMPWSYMNGIVLLEIKVKVLAKINHHNSKCYIKRSRGVNLRWQPKGAKIFITKDL
jgi:hypothetical protein